MRSERASEFLAGAFLIVGSMVFLWGGAQHPATGHVVEHAAWQTIHTGILAGPILWALGVWGVRKWLPAEKDSVLMSMGLGETRGRRRGRRPSTPGPSGHAPRSSGRVSATFPPALVPFSARR